MSTSIRAGAHGDGWRVWRDGHIVADVWTSEEEARAFALAHDMAETLEAAVQYWFKLVEFDSTENAWAAKAQDILSRLKGSLPLEDAAR